MASLAIKKKEDCICGEYFKYSEFDNLCSRCFIKKNPDDEYSQSMLLKLYKNRSYDNKYLDNILNSRKLPDDHFLLSALKSMFDTGSLIEETNFIDWLNWLETKTIYRGISTEQAIELISLAMNSKKQWVKNDLKWRIGHYACGLIIDWWNIDKCTINQVQCYYGVGTNGLPIVNKELRPAAFFCKKCNYKINGKKCKNYGNNIKDCKMSHNNLFDFLMRNININV